MFINEHWRTLYRIAFPELSGLDPLSSNSSLWPSSVAYEALGGKWKNGKRITTANTIERKHTTIECTSDVRLMTQVGSADVDP